MHFLVEINTCASAVVTLNCHWYGTMKDTIRCIYLFIHPVVYLFIYFNFIRIPQLYNQWIQKKTMYLQFIGSGTVKICVRNYRTSYELVQGWGPFNFCEWGLSHLSLPSYSASRWYLLIQRLMRFCAYYVLELQESSREVSCMSYHDSWVIWFFFLRLD